MAALLAGTDDSCLVKQRSLLLNTVICMYDQTFSIIEADHATDTKHSDDQEPGVLVPGIPVLPKYSRNYQSVPQPGLNNRSSPVYSAAVVGGATVINGMFFNRGSAEDYDAWERLGNLGWGWKGLLPYFKKAS